MQYSKQILKYFYNLKNAGHFADVTHVYCGTAGTKENGDVVVLQIKVLNGVILEAKFLVDGGVVAIASMAWLSEWLRGKTLKQARQLTAEEVMDVLSIPGAKKHIALLVVDALQLALNFKMEV